MRKKNNIYNEFIKQLDGLLAFMAIANKDVYDLIKNKTENSYSTIGDYFGHNYKTYNKHILNSAFILGFSYFENFLSNLILKCLLKDPQKLPEEKNVKYWEILLVKDHESLIRKLAEKEIAELFYKPLKEVAKYFERNLNIKWDDNLTNKLDLAQKIRNCLIHNNGVADKRLSNISSYKEGDEITLTLDEINDFGLEGRSTAQRIYEQFKKTYST